MNKKDIGFNLLELMAVLIIIGILAIIAIPQFRVARESTLDREVRANLRLIQAAEKIYRMEVSVYSSAADISTINTRLLLDLPASTNWNYKVDSVTATNFTGKAQRTLDNRVWCITRIIDDPYDASGGCVW